VYAPSSNGDKVGFGLTHFSSVCKLSAVLGTLMDYRLQMPLKRTTCEYRRALRKQLQSIGNDLKGGNIIRMKGSSSGYLPINSCRILAQTISRASMPAHSRACRANPVNVIVNHLPENRR
jgi:hypothetical protein